MNAKEERAHNLEIHKMTRSNNEIAIKNSALEVECMRLRSAIKQESEKHAANHAAMMKQVNATMELEREKINALQRQFEKERERLTEDAYKDAVAQRASHMDALGDIKRHLDTRYNEKLNENKIALDAAIRQLDEERERVKRGEQEQLAQLNEERERIMRQLNEGRERIKRDEREQLVQFLFHMDSEREKNQCQLEKERALMMEQVHNETIAQRQSNEGMLAEMKILFDAKCNAKMNELDVATHELNEEREQLQQTVQERLVQLNEEREQLQQTVQERHVQLTEEREQLQQTVQERHVQLTEEREQLQQTVQERLVQLTEEREQLQQTVQERLVQLTEEREQLQQTVQERLVQLNEERDQIDRNEKEQRNQFLIHMDSEREKMKYQMEKDYNVLVEQARKNDAAQRQSNAVILAEMKQQLDVQFNEKMNKNNIAFDAAMRQLNEQREQLKQQLHEERERNMRDDLERKKMHELQLQLENDRKHVAEQARKNDAAQRQSNAVILAEMKQQLDVQFNEKMNAATQKINEEHARIKHDDLEREKIKRQLENDRKLLAEQAKMDFAAQRQSNAVILAETKRQLDITCSEQLNKNTIAFNSGMQKLNEEREQIKRILIEERQRNKQDDLEREKTRAFQFQLEKEREHLLFEQVPKEAGVLRQNNMDAIAETKRQLDAQTNAKIKKNKMTFDASMQKLNEERDQLKKKEHDMNELFRKTMQTLQGKFEKEHEMLTEQARKEDMEQKQLNSDTLKETKKQLESRFDDAMQKLNEDRDKLKLDRKKLHDTLEKEREQFKRDELDRKKTHALRDMLEKEREQLAEQLHKCEITTQQMNEERDNVKRDQQNSDLTEEINKLKKQLKEIHAKHAHELKNRLKMDKSEMEHMHDAIDSNYAHMQLIHSLNFSDKRVMIYSHYSDKNDVERYNLLTIECVQHYFDYIIILTNCPNKWNIHSPNYNKCHFLNYNMKSDFRNYGVFIMQTSKTLMNASRLCLINDSFVIVDVNVFGHCMKRLFDGDNMSHDFLGLTSSYENVYHLQSYFMCFNSTTVPAIMDYFETRGLPTNHQAAISHYELGITSHLIEKGFSSFAVVSNDEMRHPLNTTCCKWPMVLQDIGIIKRQHFFKQYAYSAMTDANIALVAENYSYNKHLMHFLKYHGINVKVA
jgi:hypothetical protein